jgi:hypothetical protein
MSVEYKSDIRRDGNDYLSKNAEQEVSVKLGLDYVDNKPIGNKRTNSSLTLDEDWLICAEGF